MNNRNVLAVFAIVVIGFSGALIISQRHFTVVNAQSMEALDSARLRGEYLERVGWIRSNPDEKSYKDEVKNFFRWYFTEVDSHVQKFGGSKAFDEYLKELDERAGKDVVPAAGKPKNESEQQLAAAFEKKGSNIADRRVAYDTAKKMFDRFRSGRYEPVWSGSDKGMRLDVVTDDVTMVDGKPKIRFMLVIWGAQRELYADESRGVKRIRTSLEMNTAWKLFDDKGKLYGEMNAGNPSMRNDLPERMIAPFPPQMVLGYYDMDKIPSNVNAMEVSFNATSHAPSGGEALGNFLWKVTPPAEWKLNAGQTWEGATTQVRGKDEIDPAGANKASVKKSAHR